MKKPATRIANCDREPQTVPWTGTVEKGNRAALQALAEGAVLSLQATRQAVGLQEASARVALAWIRIGNATLLHDVRGYIGMIHNEIYFLQNTFAEQGQVQGSVLSSHLATVREAVEQLSISP